MSLGDAEPRSGPGETVPPFLPVRMLNEFAYCAGLGYLMWVQGGVRGHCGHLSVLGSSRRRVEANDIA